MSAAPITNSHVRLGFIGAGFVGQAAHIRCFAKIPGCTLVALAEKRPRLRRMVQDTYGIADGCDDHGELLARGGLDAVIAITRRLHVVPVATDVLDAGLHLMTEKPLAATVAQGEALVSLAKANRLLHAVGFMRRHDAGVQAARAMLERFVENGDLGPIQFVRMHCFGGEDYCNIPDVLQTDEPRPESGLPESPRAPEWLPAGLHAGYDRFQNVWSHNVDLLCHLFGRAPEVRHVDFRRDGGNLAVFDFGDFPAVFEFGEVKQNKWDDGVDIHFRRGTMTITLPPALLRNVPATVTVYRSDGGQDRVETIHPGWSWAFMRQADAFIRDLRTGAEPISSSATALEGLRLTEAMWRQAVAQGTHL